MAVRVSGGGWCRVVGGVSGRVVGVAICFGHRRILGVAMCFGRRRILGVGVARVGRAFGVAVFVRRGVDDGRDGEGGGDGRDGGDR